MGNYDTHIPFDSIDPKRVEVRDAITCGKSLESR